MKNLVLIIGFILFSFNSEAQKTDTTQTPSFFRGQITATNNGISLVPAFSLGKPAVLFDLNIGKGRLSFDPMIRFGMNGKPWTFVFWWRYRLVQQKRFSMSLGAHPSVVFRNLTISDNGVSKDYIVAHRFLAWEASPTFKINKNFNLGLYYLGSRGLTEGASRNNTFLAIRSAVSIPMSQFKLNINPQFYYLKRDAQQGTYVSATANLYKNSWPISLNGIVSKAIKTTIEGKSLQLSVGLVYNINNTYLKRK